VKFFYTKTQNIKSKMGEYLFFYGHAEKNGEKACLSNFYPSVFTYQGFNFSSSEQFFMWKKALFFEDFKIAQDILEQDDPLKCKKLGRLVKNFNEKVWTENSKQIMEIAVYQKFSQNPTLKNFLLSTKDKYLVEASPRDRIWGIGMGENNPNAKCYKKWRGKNWLGEVLVNVRNTLSSFDLNVFLKDLRKMNLDSDNLQIIEVSENKLHIGRCDVDKIPAIHSIPPSIGRLTNLTELNLSRNQIAEIPKEIGNLVNLEVLILFDNQIVEIPKEIGNLVNLQILSLNSNKITEIPKEIGNLVNLLELYLSENLITKVPRAIGKLTNLADLHLENNKITKISKNIENLRNLEYLYLTINGETPNVVKNLVNRGVFLDC